MARPQSDTRNAAQVMSAVVRRTSPYCDALLPSSIRRSAKTICMKRYGIDVASSTAVQTMKPVVKKRITSDAPITAIHPPTCDFAAGALRRVERHAAQYQM